MWSDYIDMIKETIQISEQTQQLHKLMGFISI